VVIFSSSSIMMMYYVNYLQRPQNKSRTTSWETLVWQTRWLSGRL